MIPRPPSLRQLLHVGSVADAVVGDVPTMRILTAGAGVAYVLVGTVLVGIGSLFRLWWVQQP